MVTLEVRRRSRNTSSIDKNVYMKKLLLYSAALFLLVFGVFSFANRNTMVFALSRDDCEEEDALDDRQDCFLKLEGELEKDLAENRQAQTSLKNEIAYYNGQINLTEIRIQNALLEIKKREKLLGELVEDIENLSTRIESLEESIAYQTSVLQERIRERYKSGDSSPIIVLFGSNTFDSLVKKTEYLKIMAEQDGSYWMKYRLPKKLLQFKRACLKKRKLKPRN